MLHQLSHQLNQRTTSARGSQAAMWLIIGIIAAGWLVYGSLSHQFGARSAEAMQRPEEDIIGSYTDIKNFVLATDEFITDLHLIEGNRYIPVNTSIAYEINLWSSPDAQGDKVAGPLIIVSTADGAAIHSLVGPDVSSQVLSADALVGVKSVSLTIRMTAPGATTVLPTPPALECAMLSYTTAMTPDPGFLAELHSTLNSVLPGGVASYGITITPTNDYNGQVTLALRDINPAWDAAVSNYKLRVDSSGQEGTTVSAQVDAAEGVAVALEINTNSTFNPSATQSHSFTVRASDASGKQVDMPATLTIQDAPEYAPNLNISFVAKVARGIGGQPKTNRQFNFYLYHQTANDKTLVFAPSPQPATTTYDTTNDRYAGSVMVPAANLAVGQTYEAYLKTFGFLSGKALTSITANSQAAADSTVPVSLDFGTLKAGDINDAATETENTLTMGGVKRDDIVGQPDWGLLLGDFAKQAASLLADFNNDGAVNAFDIFPFTSPDSGGSWFIPGGLRNNGRL
ncbi:MAG: hypothetical protein V1826_00635 [bacterium]